MNITIDARLALNTMTGIGNYLIHLIEALLSIDAKNKYRILIRESLNQDHPFNQWKQKNLITEKIGVKPVRPGQHFLIPMKLRSRAIDVYHYPHFDLPMIQRYRSVVTIHDLKYIIAPELFPEFGSLKKAYMNFFYRMSCRKAKKIIVVSENTKRDLVRLFHVPPEKVAVIPLASNSNFKPAANKQKIQSKLAKLGLNKKFFLVVGERRPHKNLVRIIEAFQIFKKHGFDDYKLVVIGKKYGSYSEPEQTIEQLKLNEDVIFKGYVPDEELPLYYQSAEALVFASLYEGFGIPILEAMSCETPVITSNVSSLPEVAADAALCVNPVASSAIAEALERLVLQPELKADLITKGLKRAKMYSWERTAEQTLAVYQEVFAHAASQN
ncbi:glycosyltransferase family 4 protein [candidate division KSB1 bacterium]|nr:glycosyltransferase family 4 protein [candidate division KSB1 bacterium]